MPAYNPIDFLKLVEPTQFRLRLTLEEFPSPPSLGGFVEASFAGYQPSPVEILNEFDQSLGSAYLETIGNFLNHTGGPLSFTGAYLTAPIAGVDYLVSFVNLTGNPKGKLIEGVNYIYLNFSISG